MAGSPRPRRTSGVNTDSGRNSSSAFFPAVCVFMSMTSFDTGNGPPNTVEQASGPRAVDETPVNQGERCRGGLVVGLFSEKVRIEVGES